MTKTNSLTLEQKIAAWERTKKSNYQASMRLEGIELKLDLTTLKVLYRQMKSYEDRMWVGFLISREERRYEKA